MHLTVILKILVFGWVILIAAVLVNIAAKFLRWKTWYDFFIAIEDLGLKDAFTTLSAVEVIFLFIVYPGILGLTVYLLLRIS